MLTKQEMDKYIFTAFPIIIKKFKVRHTTQNKPDKGRKQKILKPGKKTSGRFV